MRPTQAIWTRAKKKQVEKRIGESVEENQRALSLYFRDFGNILFSKPAGIVIPKKSEDVQEIVSFANSQKLPITIRGDGLSQSGQSLCKEGGLLLLTDAFSEIVDYDSSSVWVRSKTNFRDILKLTTQNDRTLPVIPYNLSLSLGGILSAGGVGASSFRFGPLVSNVTALEIITADGSLHVVDRKSPLFEACLGGQGSFGFISKVCLKLVPMPKQLVTFYLMYNEQSAWLNDVKFAENHAYAIEMFCSQASMGAKPVNGVRRPFSEWLYAMHVTVLWDGLNIPNLADLFPMLSPSKILHVGSESYLSWAMRHDSRFQAMKDFGQWELYHPWYECFISEDVLKENLNEMLSMLPLYYCPVLQISPMDQPDFSGLMMLPYGQKNLFAVMILTPGVSKPFLSVCLNVIDKLDTLLLSKGGKRYLSGFLGKNLQEKDWERHYGKHFNFLKKSKKEFDPNGIFGSHLHF